MLTPGLLRCPVSHALKILEMSGGGAVQLPTADSVRFFLQSCCDAQRQGAPTPAVSAVQVRANHLAAIVLAMTSHGPESRVCLSDCETRACLLFRTA